MRFCVANQSVNRCRGVAVALFDRTNGTGSEEVSGYVISSIFFYQSHNWRLLQSTSVTEVELKSDDHPFVTKSSIVVRGESCGCTIGKEKIREMTGLFPDDGSTVRFHNQTYSLAGLLLQSGESL